VHGRTTCPPPSAEQEIEPETPEEMLVAAEAVVEEVVPGAGETGV